MDLEHKFAFYMKDLVQNGTTLGEAPAKFPHVFGTEDIKDILKDFVSLHAHYTAAQDDLPPAKRQRIDPERLERASRSTARVEVENWVEPARIETETENGEFLKSLAEKGYAVVRVISEAHAAHIQKKYEECLDEMNPLWREAGIPGANGCGIIKNFRAGSPDCVHAGRWACREFLSKVLYGGRPCCTSLDAVAFGIIPSTPPKRSTLKPHTDMALNSPSHKLVQEMEKRGENIPVLFQGQLCIHSHEDGPHFLAGKVVDLLPVNPKDHDFTVLPEVDPATLTPVRLKPGELLVWRSDLVHANSKGTLWSNTSRGLSRLGFFVSVVPKEYRSEKARKQKLKHAEEGFSSAHPAWMLKKDGAAGHMSNPKWKEGEPRPRLHTAPLPRRGELPLWIEDLL